jgi:hypothetical protein
MTVPAEGAASWNTEEGFRKGILESTVEDELAQIIRLRVRPVNMIDS